jgi:murein DD-endopeptidase MepM/ murein hydrolase activator NlpD
MKAAATFRPGNWRSGFLAFALFAMGFGSAAAAQTSAPVVWQPSRLTNGSPALLQISGKANILAISGTWMGHSFIFFRSGKAKTWYALAGIPLSTPAGKYTLQITEHLANGRTLRLQKQVRVFQASYPRITVKVAKKYTEPSHQQLTMIAADKSQKEKTFAAVSTQRLWSGPFQQPVSAPVSDVFGTERVFNQEVQSRHQGLDFAAPAGTPVRAVNSGVVLLARPMFFEGNFVVVDHGQGLLSLYLHLSEFNVKQGELVRPGQVIGLSGGTGRATGAHLHLAVRWQGIYLNPAILLKLPFPPAQH